MVKKSFFRFCTIIIIAVLSVFIFFTINPLFLKAETSPDSDIVLKRLYSDEFPKIIFYIDFKEGSQIGSLDLKNEDLKIVENGQEVKNFRVEKVDTIKEPIGVVLALDTSGSMKGEPIEAAKIATSLFIDEMRKIDKFAVVGFSDDIKVYSSFTKDRQQLKNSIAQVEAKGETSLFDGIDISIDQFKNLDIKYKYVVVLSDGMDTVSKLKYTDIINKAKKENVTIYSIALLSKDYNPANLSEISGSTGGEMLIAASTGELKELYGNISRKIRNQYKISYTSLWPNMETIKSDIFIEKSDASDSITLSYKNPYFAPQPTRTVNEQPVSYLKYLSIWWIRLIIYVAIFICILMFLYALILIIFRPKPVLKKKTEIYGSKTPVITSSDQDTDQDKVKHGIFGRLSGLTSKVASKRGFVELFDLKLERGGLKIRGSEFMTLQIISVLIIGILIQLFVKNAFLTAAVVFLLIILPFLFINILTARRIQKFDEQLPDTLQLISGALKAGYSFNQSINMVVDETKPPISDEFARVLNEVRMGLPEKEALENSANRIGSSHFAWVVMAINVQREVGGNLSEIMEIIADTIRERARVMNQIKALTSEGRLSAIILIALPIVLGIILFTINRAYIGLLFTNRIGLVMVAFSAFLMITGIIWIIKIVNVKY
ncbi:MAG: VWA domain-containing protein [Actinobacteria bacterium]|nr:VWA domain-containing protein [Actinomycetota bacterium]